MSRAVPPYVPAAEVAKACEISRRAAISMLRRAGVLVRDGQRWKADADLLRERLGPVYARVYARLCLTAPGDHC